MRNHTKALAFARTKMSSYNWAERNLIELCDVFYKSFERELALNTYLIQIRHQFGMKAILSKTFIHYFNEEMDGFIKYLSERNCTSFFNIVNVYSRSMFIYQDQHQMNVDLFLMSYAEFLKKWDLVEQNKMPFLRISYGDKHFDIYKNGEVLLNGERVLEDLYSRYRFRIGRMKNRQSIESFCLGLSSDIKRYCQNVEIPV